MTKAYSYLRFSTPDQMRGDSYRRQTQQAQEYAARHDLELDDKLTFHDLGVSAFRGRNAEAGRLADFLEAVRLKLVPADSFLLVESLDRISRQSARKALRVLEDICEIGVTVVTLSDGRKYTADSLDNDPMSLMMSILIFIRANEESTMKARRLRAAWEAKRGRASEKPLTSRVPAWIRLDSKSGTLETIKDRAAIVKRIFKMALKGVGQHAIAEHLNSEKIPMFGGGKYWHRSYIVKILSNSAVVGTLTPTRIEYVEGKRVRKPLKPISGYYPRVVDDEIFQRVQALRIDAGSPRRGRHAHAPIQNILGGLARCPLCQSTMTVSNKGDGLRYLVCSKAKAGAGCRYHTVRYDRVEKRLLDSFEALHTAAPAPSDGPDIEAELESTQAALEVKHDELETLLDALSRGRSTAIADKVRAAEATIEELRGAESDLLARKAALLVPIMQSKLSDLREALGETPLDRTKLNTLMRQIFSGVVIDFRSGAARFQWKHGGESEIVYSWPDDDAPNTVSLRKAARSAARG